MEAVGAPDAQRQTKRKEVTRREGEKLIKRATREVSRYAYHTPPMRTLYRTYEYMAEALADDDILLDIYPPTDIELAGKDRDELTARAMKKLKNHIERAIGRVGARPIAIDERNRQIIENYFNDDDVHGFDAAFDTDLLVATVSTVYAKANDQHTEETRKRLRVDILNDIVLVYNGVIRLLRAPTTARRYKLAFRYNNISGALACIFFGHDPYVKNFTKKYYDESTARLEAISTAIVASVIAAFERNGFYIMLSHIHPQPQSNVSETLRLEYAEFLARLATDKMKENDIYYYGYMTFTELVTGIAARPNPHTTLGRMRVMAVESAFAASGVVDIMQEIAYLFSRNQRSLNTDMRLYVADDRRYDAAPSRPGDDLNQYVDFVEYYLRERDTIAPTNQRY